MLTIIAAKLKEAYHALHQLKTEHQYLGRYSVEKLQAFHKYQQSVSVYRALAVLLLSPLPTLLVLAGLDCIKLRDPRRDVSQHAPTFLRSVLSHFIMTYMFLLAGKQALGLTSRNSAYTHGKCLLISICTSTCLEALWVIVAVGWKFPVPMRELLGVTPWGILTALFNYLLAKNDLTRVLDKLKRYIPVVGTQLVLFYFLLGLSILFAEVPYPAQLAMIFVFPLVKLALKRQLWKFSRELDDISADVTICMVEISGSLYQTVCMQYVRNNLMVLLIMVMDFVQAALESRTYMSHDYIGDSGSTLSTAVKIVEAGIARQKQRFQAPLGSIGRHTAANTSQFSTSMASSILHRTWSLQPRHSSSVSLWGSLLQSIESAWRRWRNRGRRWREHRYTIQASDVAPAHGAMDEQYASDVPATEASPVQGPTVPRSIYLQAQYIRTRGSRRLMDFSQYKTTSAMKIAARGSNGGMSVGSQGTQQANKSKDHKVRRRGRSVEIPATDLKPLGRMRSKSAASNLAITKSADNTAVSPPTQPIAATNNSAPTEQDVENEIRRTIERSNVYSSPRSAVRRLVTAGRSGIIIDNVFIQRRDQARILEQTLQMLFAAEVLLFVEYMEVFMPLLYAACVGTLWELPNAKYNVLFSQMTASQVDTEVITSIAYAALELLSFLSVYRFIKTRYGISALYQLAFLLETYWMTLQGKLIGCFITILNSSTIHQGVDLTFQFNVTAQLEGVPLGD